jgi:hypothetical protein
MRQGPFRGLVLMLQCAVDRDQFTDVLQREHSARLVPWPALFALEARPLVFGVLMSAAVRRRVLRKPRNDRPVRNATGFSLFVALCTAHLRPRNDGEPFELPARTHAVLPDNLLIPRSSCLAPGDRNARPLASLTAATARGTLKPLPPGLRPRPWRKTKTVKGKERNYSYEANASSSGHWIDSGAEHRRTQESRRR